ncbi:MAG: hypothetical protein JNG84_05665 [Archangium sp.]|nr:hypothetical protein [Archangium sp.]
MIRAVLVLVCAGCGAVATPPGAERMGTYLIQATPTLRACGLASVGFSELSLEVTFSRTPDSATAWMTFPLATRDATWNGQRIISTASAPRAFAECAACGMALDETIDVAVLSASQSEAAGEVCPEDGSVPEVNPDLGVLAPAPNTYGYDGVRACGTLVTSTRVVNGEGCPSECNACVLWYRLTGVRR